MEAILDQIELRKIMEILESMEDEEKAVHLLKELHFRNKELGQWILNRDSKISHESWLEECQKSKQRVEEIIQQIRENEGSFEE